VIVPGIKGWTSSELRSEIPIFLSLLHHAILTITSSRLCSTQEYSRSTTRLFNLPTVAIIYCVVCNSLAFLHNNKSPIFLLVGSSPIQTLRLLHSDSTQHTTHLKPTSVISLSCSVSVFHPNSPHPRSARLQRLRRAPSIPHFDPSFLFSTFVSASTGSNLDPSRLIIDILFQASQATLPSSIVVSALFRRF